MIAVRGRLATIGEVFFDERPEGPPVDVLRYVQRSAPLAGASCRIFHTLLLDLSRSADALWEELHRWNRKKIRRADHRDGLRYEAWYPVGATDLLEFCEFYERVTRGARLFQVHRDRLAAYAAQGALDLSAIGRDGERLSWHAYYRTSTRARELYSVTIPRESLDSAGRAIIGRAHRLQHWRDILRFRSEGLAIFDFAGLYLGTADAKRLGIDRFKRSFGGTVVREFNCVRALTLRGRVALLLEMMLAKASR